MSKPHDDESSGRRALVAHGAVRSGASAWVAERRSGRTIESRPTPSAHRHVVEQTLGSRSSTWLRTPFAACVVTVEM